jgi:hypothetical protein
MSRRLRIRGLRLKELRLPVFYRFTWIHIPSLGRAIQTADTDLKDFGDTDSCDVVAQTSLLRKVCPIHRLNAEAKSESKLDSQREQLSMVSKHEPACVNKLCDVHLNTFAFQ